jgi:FAD/FMN-containing dehydrogenase
MQGLTFHEKFEPKGCKSSINTAAVTALAGSQFGEIDAAASAKGLTVLSGGSATVGIGGFLTGGGYSFLSPTWGLAADQIYEMEMVTPQGDILTLNECQNQELFWAMRGVRISILAELYRRYDTARHLC